MNSVVYMYWEIMVLNFKSHNVAFQEKDFRQEEWYRRSTKQMESCGLDPRSIQDR